MPPEWYPGKIVSDILGKRADLSARKGVKRQIWEYATIETVAEEVKYCPFREYFGRSGYGLVVIPDNSFKVEYDIGFEVVVKGTLEISRIIVDKVDLSKNIERVETRDGCTVVRFSEPTSIFAVSPVIEAEVDFKIRRVTRIVGIPRAEKLTSKE